MNLHLSAFIRRITMLIMACLIIAITTVGQGPGGVDDLGNEPDVPVDGGISLLLAAGAVYGGSKIRRQKSDIKAKSRGRADSYRWNGNDPDS
jgi:hypothetical protein